MTISSETYLKSIDSKLSGLDSLRKLTDREWDALKETLILNREYIPQAPTKQQSWFLGLSEKEILYGGAAGGGKTSALLMAALQYVHVPSYAAILFRRSYTDLELPDALIPRSKEWLTGKAKWRGDRYEWVFPNKATLTFGYISAENDKYRYQGAQFQFIGWDELTQFCLIPETEVLTETGWKTIKKIEVGEKVASLTPDKNIIYSEVTGSYGFPYEGDLLSVTTKSLQYVATPNHKIVIEGQKNHEWRFCEVRDFPAFAYHPQTGNWVGEESEILKFHIPMGRGLGNNANSTKEISTDDWLMFLGWYLSEGSAFLSAKSRGGTSPCVSIRQTKHAPELDDLMKRLQWRVRDDGDGGYKIYSRQLYDILKPLGNSYTKYVPRWIMRLSKRQLKIFFDAFVNGDGHKTKTGAITFGLGSEALIDDLQEIALKLGRRSTKSYSRVKNKYDVYRLYIHSSKLTRTEVRKKHVKPKGYKGFVYCITVEPHHTFLARYNGRLFWSGNTEGQYRYLFSRLRRLEGSYVPLRMRAASNPGGVGHVWVRQRFLVEGHKEGRLFVPAKLWDNPYLDREEYVVMLSELDPVTRKQLLEGDWTARESGGKFKREWFTYVENAPKGMKGVRFWDLAATKPRAGADPDWTAGVLLGRKDGIYYIVDVKRLRGTPAEVERVIKQTAIIDRSRPEFTDVDIYMEEEPGSSGIALVSHYSRNILSGFSFRGQRTTGSKEIRANPVSAAAEMGNVVIVIGPWLSDYLDEMEAFPSGAHEDQCDGTSGAFKVLSDIPERPMQISFAKRPA